MSDALLGVVLDESPAVVISQGKRFIVVVPTDERPGSVVRFVQRGSHATEVRAALLEGEPMQFGPRGESDRERTGIVVRVYDDGASFIDVDSGENVDREGATDLEVGDQCSFTVMSDFLALELERLPTAWTSAADPPGPPRAISAGDRERLARAHEAGLFLALTDDRIEAMTQGVADDRTVSIGSVLRRHLLESRDGNPDVVLAPASAVGARRIRALSPVLRNGPGYRQIALEVPGAPARVFEFRTHADVTRIFDIALEAVGDPRRLAPLSEDTDDLEEILYVLVTPQQSTLLEELGWLETMLELGAPREVPPAEG